MTQPATIALPLALTALAWFIMPKWIGFWLRHSWVDSPDWMERQVVVGARFMWVSFLIWMLVLTGSYPVRRALYLHPWTITLAGCVLILCILGAAWWAGRTGSGSENLAHSSSFAWSVLVASWTLGYAMGASQSSFLQLAALGVVSVAFPWLVRLMGVQLTYRVGLLMVLFGGAWGSLLRSMQA